ncbi:MAG: TonB-dependent receptor plug domain-containing protein, partial [Bacteroidaceae bacterium]|nr:TonB-dependent receptor plug domain-containing protein [Bacteroidaceae bacterium]
MAFAQKQATGTVFDSDTGEPMVGVAVKVKGTNIGVLTDINGKFVLRNIPDKVQTLDFTIVGMQPLTVKIQNNMKVYMSSAISDLDEVMVVAYGTQKKSSFTGSAAVVDAQEIGKVQVTNAVDALKGKAAGVQITSMSGQPDQESTIRIRGFNSLVAGQNPLIVLDGSPYDGTLNSISPADIESMTVLKDAASTALYGARGGNGVILITTKSGKMHKDAEITVDMKWGANMKGTRRYDVVNDPAGYYEMYYQGLYNYAANQLGKDATGAWQWANANLVDNTGGFGLGYNVYNVPAGQTMIGKNGKLNPNATLGNLVTGRDGNQYYLTPDDWNDETYHTGLRQDYSVSASGSSDKGNYYASLNYLGNEGITTNSNYERITTRLKADYNLKSWLKLGANVSYTHDDSKYVDRSEENGEGTSSAGNVFALQYLAPIYPVYMRDATGKILTHNESGIPAYDYGDATSGLGIARPYMGQSNPLSDMLVNTRKSLGNK